jgi:hypothetical protein
MLRYSLFHVSHHLTLRYSLSQEPAGSHAHCTLHLMRTSYSFHATQLRKLLPQPAETLVVSLILQIVDATSNSRIDNDVSGKQMRRNKNMHHVSVVDCATANMLTR